MASRAWRPGHYRWQVAPRYTGADQLARQLGTSPLVAQILHNRGIDDPADGQKFLDPRLGDLLDPALLQGCQDAARRIAKAIAQKQRIVIYGDYDVDGITSVAIMHACLHLAGADVHYYVPHRLDEGYGVNMGAMQRIIADGTKLIVTVDCGISADEPIALATAAGVDVIVTDHHSPPPTLPRCCAIVHPALPGQLYPNPHASGAGVALKLAWQVAREVCGQDRVDKPMKDFLLNATCLAALGTIADVVPLVGENRVLAMHGLRALPRSEHPGLRALIDSAGLGGEKLDAYHVGFVLAPRLNACGRMGHARLAIELLTDAPADKCVKIAEYLSQQNVERQKVERDIVEEAQEMVRAQGMDRDDCRVIVLSSGTWHGGVIGIVASRMVDRFSRPAILIAINGDGLGHGSGRSVRGFHMRDALAACSEHLVSFGGHAMAGGVRIESDKIDAFRQAMTAYAAKNLPTEQMQPTLEIDAESSPVELTPATVAALGKLAPFGQGNPAPLLLMRGMEIVGPPRRIGNSGATASLFLRAGGMSLRAVGFGMGDLADLLAGVNQADVVAEPSLNTFNGRTSVELKLKDVEWKK